MVNFFRNLFSDFAPKTEPKQRKRSFTGAQMSRLTSDWQTLSGAGPNRDLYTDLRKLRERSQDLAKNNRYMRKFMASKVSNILGHKGFKLQMRITQQGVDARPDNLANDAIELAWRKADKYFSMRGLCRREVEQMVLRSCMRDV